MTGYNARLTINGKEIPLAKVAMTPAVDPALEAAASALRADLAARGIPADELPESVMLAMVVQQGRIERLEETCRVLHRWLERLSDGYAVLRAERFPDLSDDARVARDRIDIAALEREDRVLAEQLRMRQLIQERAGSIPAWTPDSDASSAASPPEAPRFRHDCPDCVFLGRSADGTRDLYWCRDEGRLLCRGSDTMCFGAGPAFLRHNPEADPDLVEAHRRAAARGLIGGAGEGGG
jgi:hypothetical protein